MTIVLFEDERVSQLHPATLGRAAPMISCGGYRLVDLLGSLGEPLHLLVRPHLRPTLETDGWHVGLHSIHKGDSILFVNGRVVPSVECLAALCRVIERGEPCIVRHGGTVLVALLKPTRDLPALPTGPDDWGFFLDACQLPAAELELPLLEYPHDIVRYNLQILTGNLTHRLAQGGYREIADGVFAAAGAKLGQYVVTDTSKGPIVLDENASIGPYCFLRGPAYVGPASRVIEYAAIKDSVSLGHTTKIGGEVEGSVIEPYTNKQHHGFLGHSYLGSWVNLGAGTCNSDLKNTYGQVNMDYAGHKVPTGMQFVGCMVGDYAKTAINTGIFTGKVIGVCSMVYGFVTTNVPSFTNYARSFGQVTEAPVEVLLAAQARMFARRNVEQRPCDVQLLHDMYSLTVHERHMAGEPLSL